MQPRRAHNKTMPQQIRIHGAVQNSQSKTRRENIFKQQPQQFRVEFFVWHGLRPKSGVTEKQDAGLKPGATTALTCGVLFCYAGRSACATGSKAEKEKRRALRSSG